MPGNKCKGNRTVRPSRFYLCYRRGKQESCALIALMDSGSSLSEFREYRHQYRDRYNSKTI